MKPWPCDLFLSMAIEAVGLADLALLCCPRLLSDRTNSVLAGDLGIDGCSLGEERAFEAIVTSWPMEVYRCEVVGSF